MAVLMSVLARWGDYFHSPLINWMGHRKRHGHAMSRQNHEAANEDDSRSCCRCRKTAFGFSEPSSWLQALWNHLEHNWHWIHFSPHWSSQKTLFTWSTWDCVHWPKCPCFSFSFGSETVCRQFSPRPMRVCRWWSLPRRPSRPICMLHCLP